MFFSLKKTRHRRLAWLSKTAVLVPFQLFTILPSLSSPENPFPLKHTSSVSDSCEYLKWELGKIVSSSYWQIDLSLNASLLKNKNILEGIVNVVFHMLQGTVCPCCLASSTDRAVILSVGRHALKWHKKKIIGKRPSWKCFILHKLWITKFI